MLFCSIIRSLLEYACETLHHGLTKQQSNNIEYIQKRDFKNPFKNIPYEKAFIQCNIHTYTE